jgi:hypothetical protein
MPIADARAAMATSAARALANVVAMSTCRLGWAHAITGAHQQGAKWEGPSRKARLNIVTDDGHFRGCGVSCPRSTYFDLVRKGTSRNNQLTIERL